MLFEVSFDFSYIIYRACTANLARYIRAKFAII